MIEVQINKLCKDRGVTPYKLAKEIGLSHPALWKLRHGRMKGIKFDVLEEICRVLKCSPNDILVIKPGRSAGRKGR